MGTLTITMRLVLKSVKFGSLKETMALLFYRCGPYLAHITPENADFIYNYFRREIFGFREHKRPPQIYKMTDRLRNFFERLGAHINQIRF